MSLHRFLLSASELITPIPEKVHKYVNSATSSLNEGEKDYGAIAGAIKDLILDVLSWVFNGISPFVEWGCKIVIVSCIVIYYCSQEKKYIGTGIKFAIGFILFLTIRSALN